MLKVPSLTDITDLIFITTLSAISQIFVEFQLSTIVGLVSWLIKWIGGEPLASWLLLTLSRLFTPNIMELGVGLHGCLKAVDVCVRAQVTSLHSVYTHEVLINRSY